MSDHLVAEIVDALKSVLPKEDSIALHGPVFQGQEWTYVKECLDTGWVSSVGKYVDLFEKQLADFTGVKHAVAVVNGTAALHISLLLSGVKPGDEVLLPTLTFVATANAVTYCQAIPHFVDSAMNTLGLDPYKLADYLKEVSEIGYDGCYNRTTGRRIKAVLPMHTFGHPVDLDPLVDVCETFRLELIEDAAESLGSYYKGKHTGNWGKLSAVSFNGNKIVTTGGGGAILTNDEQLAKYAKHITTTAKIPHKWAYMHDQIGFNYRMPNINAALGCAQLESLPQFIAQKRKLTTAYQQVFDNVKGVSLFVEPSFAKSNYWLQTILLDDQHFKLRDTILETTNTNGIMTRPVWNLMHTLPMYEGCPRMDCFVAEQLANRIINIPSSASLVI